MYPPHPSSSPLASYYVLMVMVVVCCVPSPPPTPFVSPCLVLQTAADGDGGCLLCTLPTPYPTSCPLASYYILMVMVVVCCVPSPPPTPFVSPCLVLQTAADGDGGCLVCTLPNPPTPQPPSSPLASYYILMVMVVVWCVPSLPPFVSPCLVLHTDGDDDGGCFMCTLPTPLRLPLPRTTY